MSFNLEDLGLAYRKAKVDLFYSSNPDLFAIAAYEENLSDNLNALLILLNGSNLKWVEQAAFIGGWTFATKSVTWADRKIFREQNGTGLVFSSPAEDWDHTCELLSESEGYSKPDAEFRLMAQCSIDFHVLSALWMLKVGHQYDAKLTRCAYGNRLRRTQDGKQINPLSLGSFVPYLKPFRDWRDNGISSMRTALDSNKKIVALTADVSSFYHELKPSFMLESSFLDDVLSLDLSESEKKLNRLFIKALEAWAASTPLKKGLPVGLPASAVVANMALIELDRVIEQQVVPLYYGRYVDDILLVMENGAHFRSADELWDWLFERSDGKLAWADEGKSKKISFQPSYFKSGKNKSLICFANSKNKVFMLSGETGKTLVDAIAHQIHERASEWRAMPRLPHSAEHVGTDLLAATQSDGETADNLRKTDALTMRRAGFAIKLRDFEAYERDLPPEAWKAHRRAFFRAFTQHVLVLPQFFELSIYLPRVIRLATACEDFRELRKIIRALELLCEKVKQDCSVSIKAWPEGEIPADDESVLSHWEGTLFKTLLESIIAAFPPQLSRKGKQLWKDNMADYSPSHSTGIKNQWPWSIKAFQSEQARFFSFDLAHMPFRFIGLPEEMVAQRGIPERCIGSICDKSAQMLPQSILRGAKLLGRWSKLKGLPRGLLFATRPFNLAELFVLSKDVYSKDNEEEMRAVVLALRGFTLNDKMPCMNQRGVLGIPDGTPPSKYRIAVASWQTRLDSWAASVTKESDPDIQRYSRLNHLLDGVISNPEKSRYLILPELAVPAHWFVRIARKLQGRGISLIAGVEYLHAKDAKVHNQVWAALSHDGLGFPSTMIYRQDKQRPALHEEQELHRMAGLEMKPEKAWSKPPIIQHGEFRFALLVCSELTNIGYRSALRGKIDALFVPEWNQDTETFNALVESAALDIHAYVIQCNDRQYGDSRIRAPYKDSWKRDVLKVKGGITDYCVIGEIDIQALRRFQSSHRSPAGPFKPVPDGFKITKDRRVLPR
ncbi:RNA-directed DNA polymerase [Pseudomonas fluorescens]|uniref:Reverse transcriptase n=1 Tax=Pseudomonas fluorescens TaxID=294 RepID=A0A0F4SRJ0_PSEFL|nr:RNA-directed DNA polymerase [Pseudomonas fluorescens]KJZ34499.1 Reverse transcriptase [Pseudomonas fluorescens]